MTEIAAGQTWASSGPDIHVTDVSDGVVTYHAGSGQDTFTRPVTGFEAWVERVRASLK